MMPVAPLASSWARRFAQLLASACEGHPFGGGHVDERVMAVRNLEVMTAVNREVANVFVHPFDAGQPRFAVRQRRHAFGSVVYLW